MKLNIKDTSDRANKILVRLVAEKKRVVLALSLVCVMVFMWVRVLSKKAPEASKATSMPGMAGNENDSDSHLQISYIELPNIPGRNDVVRRDYFASNGWRNFLKTKQGNNNVDVKGVNVVSTGGNEEVIAFLAQKLNLEAIMLGTSPTSPKGWTGSKLPPAAWTESNPPSGGRAFINDKLLGVGDKLLIRDRDRTYECEVVTISENEVSIRYGPAEGGFDPVQGFALPQITLKLIRSIEVTDDSN